MRKPYPESCEALRSLGLVDGPLPPLPPRMPAHEDEELGVEFFRMHVEDADLSALTLPRTFFGRSLVARCRWAGTDLTESNLCWNDFEDCDFSDAVLAGSDLRASNYLRCGFDRADLRSADLRRSSFEDCSFQGAHLEGARVTPDQLRELGLDAAQRSSVAIEPDDGPEPPGG